MVNDNANGFATCVVVRVGVEENMPLKDTCEMDKPSRVLVVDDYEPWH